MEKLIANKVKIGILSNIRRRIVNQHPSNINYNTWTLSFTMGSNLRGILFTEQKNENMGNDILYPAFEYPILGQGSIDTPVIGITESEDLGPLLKYYGLTELSRQDLQKFINEILLNKKWLKEYHQLFGFVKNKYGPLTLKFSDPDIREVLPEALGDMIYKVHEKNGFCLSKKEQYRPR